MKRALCFVVAAVLAVAIAVPAAAEGEDEIVWMEGDIPDLVKTWYDEFEDTTNGPTFTYCESTGWLSMGERAIYSENYCGVVDMRTGETVDYDMAIPSPDGIITVTKDGKTGYVDGNGDQLTGLIYEIGSDFLDGHAVARRDGGCYLIDTSGNETYLGDYDGGRCLGEGLLAMYKYGGDSFLLDLEGNVLAEGGSFSQISYGLIMTDEGFVTKKGRLVIDLSEKGLRPVDNFSGGLAVVFDDNKWERGYIDTSGEVVIPVKYTYADSFTGGLARVMEDDETFFIDTNGDRRFTPDTFRPGDREYVGGYEDGRVVYARSERELAVVDGEGNEVFTIDYNGNIDAVPMRFENNVMLLSAAATDRDDEVIDVDGDVVLGGNYDISPVETAYSWVDGQYDYGMNKYFIVRDGDRMGLFTTPDLGHNDAVTGREREADGQAWWRWALVATVAVLTAGAVAAVVLKKRKKAAALGGAGGATIARYETDVTVTDTSTGRDEGVADAGDGGMETGKKIVGVFTPPEAPTYCPWCGKELKAGFAFCPRCGKELPR